MYFFFVILFMYFRLYWFSLLHRLLSLQRVAATLQLQWAGLSSPWLFLWSTGSRVCRLSSFCFQGLECGLSSCGSWAQLPCGVWDLPGSGIKPISSALAGDFFTTEPSGKSSRRNFVKLCSMSLWHKLVFVLSCFFFFNVILRKFSSLQDNEFCETEDSLGHIVDIYYLQVGLDRTEYRHLKNIMNSLFILNFVQILHPLFHLILLFFENITFTAKQLLYEKQNIS